MKKMIVTICITVVVAVLVILFFRHNNSDSAQENLMTGLNGCEMIEKSNVQTQIKQINEAVSNYTSNTKDIIGKSTEGGQQTNFSLDETVWMITQLFYGESGRSEISYYLEDGKVFYFAKKNFIYAVPLSEDPNGEVKSVQQNEFYLGENQNLCFWFSNGEMQSNTTAAEETVNLLISDLQ